MPRARPLPTRASTAGTALGLVAALASLAVVAAPAQAAPDPLPASADPTPAEYAFIGQTYLGNRYQVDTGKLGEIRAADPRVKAYAKEMDRSHVQVEDRLVALLTHKGWTPPPTSLLAGAYKGLVRDLAARSGADFDRAYVQDQVDYQVANDALYRWAIAHTPDPELKAFEQQVLIKIDQHKDMAEGLARGR